MSNRLFFIDFLRVSSAIIILFFHSVIHMGCRYPFLHCFFFQGATVMTLFFMLSGFIVSAQYGNKSLMTISSLSTFYKKKAFTLVPVYLVFYAAHLIYFWNPRLLQENLILFPIELTLTQSWMAGLGLLSHNGGSWFISCLAFCLFMAPFLNEIFRQQTNKQRSICIVILYGMAMYTPIAAKMVEAPNLYDNPLLRCSEFAIGMLLYPLFLRVKEADIRPLYLRSGALFSAAVLFLTITFCTLFCIGAYPQYNFVCIPCFIALIILGGNAWSSCSSRILRTTIGFFNSFTYEFYLAQFFTWSITSVILAKAGIARSTIPVILVGFAVSTVLGFAMSRLITLPMKKWLSARYIR